MTFAPFGYRGPSYSVVEDTRPRCASVGPDPDGGDNYVPCQLHQGHAGYHEWDDYDPFRTVRWRKDRRPLLERSDA